MLLGGGRGPGSLGKSGWKRKIAIGFFFPVVPGVCLDVYLKSQTPLCSSVGAEYVSGMPADRNNVSSSAQLTCSVLSQWGPSALQPGGKYTMIGSGSVYPEAGDMSACSFIIALLPA